MAQRIVVTLVDDVDGGTADETVTLALDGATYQLDLSTENAADLRDQLAPWLAKARRVSGQGKGATRKPQDRTSRTPAAGRVRRGANDAVRAWARANGWPDLGTRGRIPAAALAAYETAAKAGAAS